MRFMSGNLCHQIEHHLYPDLPSNRLHEIAVQVRQVCDKYDLPYTTGSFLMQYGKAWRTIAKLSLPDRYLHDTADDAPETRSERMFSGLEPGFAGTDLVTGRRRGLKTAIAAVRQWRRDTRAKTPSRPTRNIWSSRSSDSGVLLAGNLRERRLRYSWLGVGEAIVMALCQRARTPLDGDQFT
jgi:hypothetical protein